MPAKRRPTEVSVVTTVPVTVILRRDSANRSWCVTSVTVEDTDADLDLKHLEIHDETNDTEIPLDSPRAWAVHDVLQSCDWPPWEFGH